MAKVGPKRRRDLAQATEDFKRRARMSPYASWLLELCFPHFELNKQAFPSCIFVYLHMACFQDVTGACGNAENTVRLKCHKTFY